MLLIISDACTDRFGKKTYEGEEYSYNCGSYICIHDKGLQVKHLGELAVLLKLDSMIKSEFFKEI